MPDTGGLEEIMGRREQREQIFKLLFRVEFNPKEEMPEQCQLFFEDEENLKRFRISCRRSTE